MSADDRARFEVLLENIDTKVTVIAEGYVVLNERLDRIETKVDAIEKRVERLEIKVDVIEKRLDRLESKFDSFASDTNQRLHRIETHLGLNGAPPTKPRRKRAA